MPATSSSAPLSSPGSPVGPTTTSRAVAGVGGVRLAVHFHSADEAAVPVMLVHGFGSSAAANWSATGWLRQLGRAGIPAVTVDLRGHGLSAKPIDPQAYSLPILVADLQHVMACLPAVWGPVPRIDLIGYSMGGRLVGELAAAAGPGATAAWPVDLPQVRRAVIGGYDGRPLFEGMDAAEFRAFAAAIDGVAGVDTLGRRVARIALAVPGNDLSALSALVKGVSAVQYPLAAEAIAAPTLVAAGDRDLITAHTARWASGLPLGRHLYLPGRDHVSAVTAGLFRSAAVEFLREEGPAGPARPPGTVVQRQPESAAGSAAPD